jgi:hypothetical protein
MLEKDLDLLLQDGKPKATACRGASGCFGAGDLVITSMPEGRIVHWRGMALCDLLKATAGNEPNRARLGSARLGSVIYRAEPGSAR